jgi:hypothetical protein
MKIPLRIERQVDDMDLFEGVEKIIKYKIHNENRFVVKDISIKARTIKENGVETTGKYVKNIKGIKTRLIPKDYFEISITLKLNKEYNETVTINEKEELATIDIEIEATGTMIIAKS